MTAQVVVVGAGPAGLTAAAAAARAGASVQLLDERPETGGQLRYRVQPVAAAIGAPAEAPRQVAERLLADALHAGVGVHTGSLAAGCFENHQVVVVADNQSMQIDADAIVVATGSTDLPYPFPGATFPGVFSGRGLQILLNQYRVRPGRQFAVIGGGAEAEELVVDIMLAGGEVVWSGIAPAPFLRALGADGVRGIVVGQEELAVDTIAIAVGRQADPALATMAGTPLAFSAELGGLVPVLDGHLGSAVPGLFVAGDAAGVGSVAAVIAEGRLAGIAAAAWLGLASADDVAAVVTAGGPELAWRMQTRAALSPLLTQPYE